MTPWPRRGEVWSVRIPGQASDPRQPRPALVLSADIRNRLADDLIVVPIFTRGAEGPTHVPLPRGAGGVKRDSVLFCEELTTLDRNLLGSGPWGAAVGSELLAAVTRAVRRAIGDVVPEPG